MLYENLLDIIGNTPIVKINNIFDTDSHADVYLKLENFNPGGSVKDRAALGIIEKAEKEGKLKPGNPGGKRPCRIHAQIRPIPVLSEIR